MNAPNRWLWNNKKYFSTAAYIAVALLAGAALVVHHFWPFTESAVRARLASATSAEVHFTKFHQRLFPPGCVAEDVSFQRENSGPPLISVQRLTINSSPLGLFRHRLSQLRAEGMHVVLGRSSFSGTHSSDQETTIDKFVSDGAVLEIQRGNSQAPLRFSFHRFRLYNLGGNGPTGFEAVFDNPLPAGLVRTSGHFGPWNGSNPEASAVSGKYSLENADLSVFHSIAGSLSSTGDFSGTFKQISVEGTTATPEFEVTDTRHKLPLQTHFSAAVDAVTGDTVLRTVRATFGKDEIDAHGSIARRADGKRSALIDLQCDRGRIEDTFYPFIQAGISPVTGAVAFQMHVVIPSGKERFLKRIQLSSDFRIRDARFTNQQTESRLQKISEEPGQKDPSESGPADFAGRVSVTQGVAHIADLSARDQGAFAQFRGSYNLIDERVDMRGRLETKASLMKTTSGIKAVFAKAIEPFFKGKKHNEKVLPVKISGTYKHPTFGLDLNSKM